MTGKSPVVAVVGTGLIGTSLGLALKSSGYCETVLGHSRTRRTAEHAMVSGALDGILENLEGVAEADIVLLCAPVGAIIAHLRQLAGLEMRSRLILDVGSIKAPIMKAAGEAGLGEIFVGGHPMAGSEKSGPSAASAGLFEGKTFFLAPTAETSEEAFEEARALVAATGANPVEIDADEHDRIVALTSHLPYLLASALSGLAGEQSGDLAHVRDALGGVFRDMTRVAGGSPEMWADILKNNASNVREWLQEFVQNAQSIIAAADNPEELKKALRSLRAAHRELLK